MKTITMSVAALFIAASAGAQTLPGANALKEKAAASGNVAYTAAKTAFNKAVKDIPFRYNSSELNLGDPKYKVAGVNVEEFMKKTVIPALVKVVELAPADKQVTITGHASRRGPEEAAGNFQVNIALSRARAEAVIVYLTANSSLPASRFKVSAAGSSLPLSGKDPASEENCRVSIFME